MGEFIFGPVIACHPLVFLDSITDSCHHGTTMRFPQFFKRTKPVPLTPEEPKHRTQKIETLKAGKLASLALALTERLIEQWGPRRAASEQANNVAEALEKEYAAFCDHTEKTEVLLDTNAHSRVLKLLVVLYPLLVLFLLVGFPFLSLILFLLYGWYASKELYFYRPLAWKRAPLSKGMNVHGVLEPKNKVENTILFTAHHDSAQLYHFNKLDRLSYAGKVILPLLLFLLTGILSIIQLVAELAGRVLLLPNAPSLSNLIILLLLAGASPWVFQLRLFYEKEASPGAGDNLASSAMTVQLARYFRWKRDCNNPLEHTRLVFCSFDGEELGLRGSRQWYKTQADQFAGAIVLNFDAIYYADRLTFLEKDVNATVPLSDSLARRCVSIAQSMGYEAKSEAIPRLAGGTDAAEASRAGFAACTLTSVAWDDQTKASVYHTQDDLVSAIQPKAVEQAISIAIRLVELVDNRRLWDEPKKETEHEEPESPKLEFTRLSHR